MRAAISACLQFEACMWWGSIPVGCWTRACSKGTNTQNKYRSLVYLHGFSSIRFHWLFFYVRLGRHWQGCPPMAPYLMTNCEWGDSTSGDTICSKSESSVGQNFGCSTDVQGGGYFQYQSPPSNDSTQFYVPLILPETSLGTKMFLIENLCHYSTVLARMCRYQSGWSGASAL